MKTTHHLLCKKPKTGILGNQTATRITVRGDAVTRLVVLRAEFFTTGLLGFLDRATNRGLSIVCRCGSIDNAVRVLSNRFRGFADVRPIDRIVEFFACDFAIAPRLDLWAIFRGYSFPIQPLPYAPLSNIEVGSQRGLADLVFGEVVGEFHKSHTRKTHETCQQENSLHRSLGNL